MDTHCRSLTELLRSFKHLTGGQSLWFPKVKLHKPLQLPGKFAGRAYVFSSIGIVSVRMTLHTCGHVVNGKKE
jgi:hypothetical protein